MKKVFAFIALSYFIFFFLLPPFQTPDEQAHFEVIYWTSYFQYPKLTMEPTTHIQPGESLQEPFAEVVQHTGIIPNFTAIKNSKMQKLVDYPKSEKQQFTPFAIQSYNPPIYYMIGSVFLQVARLFHTSILTQFYVTRLTSGLFYFATIFVVYKTFLFLFKKEKMANSFTLLFGLNPLLMQSGIGISSDIAVVFFSAVFFYLTAKLELSFKSVVLLGLVAGLACLSRATGLILIPGFIVYLFFQEKDKKLFLKYALLFGSIFLLIQVPWFLLNFIRYHTPVMAIPAFGAAISQGIYVSLPEAILLTVWNLRHVYMHFSGFLGWNEAFPFPPIFITYTVIFILFSSIGIFYLWRNNKNKLMITSTIFLFLLFFILDVGRKIHSHQAWETGGRDALLIYLPLLLFTIKGFSVVLKKKTEQIAIYFGYFAIWYYYFILIFVLIPRYYV